MAKYLNKKLILLGLGILGGFGVKEIIQLSADPSSDKDCETTAENNGGQSNVILKEIIFDSLLPWSQKYGTVNDSSCLNRTNVAGIVKVKNVEDIKNAVVYAKENNLKISLAGVKHSQGGQAFSDGGLILDITNFNKITLNEEAKTINVESGATWHDIQNKLHPKYAVKAMQSTDIFTVGGSISVNAHGMDHQAGSVGGTIISMNVLTPSGEILKVSKTENPELFKLIVGGYGLFGIILDVDLEITENLVYNSAREIINYKEFPEYFKNTLEPNKDIGLFYGHLSTSPDSLLNEMLLFTYTKAPNQDELQIPELTEVTNTKLRRFIINFSKKGPMAMRLKWFTEKYIEPKIESCSVTRNQAMKDGEECLISRNEPMHDSVKYLKNDLKTETDILQEYFIPRENFVAFVDDLRSYISENKINLLNASVRIVHKEENELTYSPENSFAIVLYINQKTNVEGNEKMKKTTEDLINISKKHGGRFFLPYQLHYSKDQLKENYPNIENFFAKKKQYDPNELLVNKWYLKYANEN